MMAWKGLSLWEVFEGPLEPVVQQDVGIDAFGLAGDALDAGLFEAENVVGKGWESIRHRNEVLVLLAKVGRIRGKSKDQ